MFHGVGAEAWEQERRVSKQVRNWLFVTVLAVGTGILLKGALPLVIARLFSLGPVV